jgi:hypothetical protein
MLLRLLQLIFLIVLSWGTISQILIPGLKNRPYFPAFRRRKVEGDLADVKEAIDQAEINNQIKGEKERLKKITRR